LNANQAAPLGIGPLAAFDLTAAIIEQTNLGERRDVEIRIVEVV
jgi:hypothetical protein